MKMRLANVLGLTLLLGSPAFAQGLTGTLQKAKETNTIVIGYQEGSIPFSYLDANQKPIGYTIEICLKIAEEVKKQINSPDMKVEYTPVVASNRIPLLLNGTIDMNCASATNNAERQKQVAFVNSHFLTATRFIAKKTSNVKTFDDLKGKTVVSIAGSTNIAQLNKANTDRSLGLNIISAKDQLESFLMVETDRAIAYVMDDIQLVVAAARSKEPLGYYISSEALSQPEPFGIIIRKDDPAFKALADKVTAAFYTSPEIEAHYKKWFLSPIPPAGVNFNSPMTDELRQAFKTPTSSPDPADYALKK